MESRLERDLESTPLVTFEVDRAKIDRAYRRKGIKEKMLEPLTDVQKEFMNRKGLSELQVRLRYLFKLMLDEELEEEGYRISGLSLKDKMLRYEDVAEQVFLQWSSRVGISHLYHLLIKGDENEIHTQTHDIVTCYDACELTLEGDEISCNSEEKGSLFRISVRELGNTSGLNAYERFNRLLRILK